MTIIKLNSAGTAVQVVDDYGRVYQTSKQWVEQLIAGRKKGNFIPTSRLPFNYAKNRFKKSELYDPKGVWDGKDPDDDIANDNLTTANDAVSVKTIRNNEDKKVFEDKSIW